jgi:hypothetical protein
MGDTMSIHAHLTIESADCDGRYSRTATVRPVGDESEWDFHAITIGNVMAFSDNGTAEITPDGFTFMTSTDEGFIHTDVTWCEDDDVNTPSTFRDHSAESVGY